MSTPTTRLSFPMSICNFKGDTGAGKTSLMNALLDHADVLPTSGIRACTAVVVQIVHNSHSDTEYVAEIEFLSESVRWSMKSINNAKILRKNVADLSLLLCIYFVGIKSASIITNKKKT